MSLVIATDIGGTFTDMVAFDTGSKKMIHAKSHTDPGDLTGGIMRCLQKSDLALPEATDFVHGSTVAINTAIERKGAVTALIVTRGTRDVYTIGRGNRPEAYNLFFERPEPFVPRNRIIEIDERMDAAGNVVTPLDPQSVRDALQTALGAEAESVAVCLLHAYASPRHEEMTAELIGEVSPGSYLSLSHEILREYREYERMSTTVLNAYVGPRVSEYIAELEKALAAAGFGGRVSIMQSNGGVMAPATARKQPVRTMESGPVSGVIAASQLSRRLGIKHAVAFDMGGTTAKAALIEDGAAVMSEGYFVGDEMSGHPVMLPVVDVIEVGAGGGSIAHLDEVGALRIGPESAGGYPGPICYGWGGTSPTVTDANAVLGRLNPGRFLGGEMPLDVENAAAAIGLELATRLGLSTNAAAQAVIDVAVNKMALAVRAVSIERGLDPRDCALIAFGGAGPLHATAIARDLDIPTVIVPPLPGHYSAFGMLVTDVRHDYVRTCYGRLDEIPLATLTAMIAEMTDEGRALLESEGLTDDAIAVEPFFDLRYAGQEFTLRVPVGDGEVSEAGLRAVRDRFDEMHEARYGHVAKDEAVEIVNVRLVATGRRDTPELDAPPAAAGPATPVGIRQVGFAGPGGCVLKDSTVWQREDLAPGAKITGPAIVEEYASTIVIGEGDIVTVGDLGEIIVSVASRRPAPAGAAAEGRDR
ncbi:MAG TPA: hydantoinase/oxoprolinase family protein [Stellaceae bacterium]|jgi:N-methylhydantoinase A|nr:hydantoinase/oxoprolinase family protein [Stellaceae bacterium]